MNTENNSDPQTDDAFAEVENTESGEDVLEFASESNVEATPADEVSELRGKLAEMEKLALRYQADLENFRKRSRAQMQDQMKYASLPLISDLLEAVDNLNRATESAENSESSDGLLDGVKMVSMQISNILDQQGCKKIDTVGQPFDPNFHQAIQMQPSGEFAADTVMIEVRTGFTLHDRVIRPAQVFVSTGPESE